ncbi:MAG: glycosyltransferase family 2 protein, partial [Solirubrobacteraceae bacterium]
MIPTIGRPELLLDTLKFLSACVPASAEVLIVDQSPDCVSAGVLDQLDLPGARVIPCAGHGRGLAVNEGLRAAANEMVAIVDDDCVVGAEWIAVVDRELTRDPSAVICGQVLPSGDPARTPSTLILNEPREYTGEIRGDVLYAGNMACRREDVLSFGGFDERIVPAAEDCDFCYRWLRAGRHLRHVPELIVWHCDWRERDELRRHYVGYHEGR